MLLLGAHDCLPHDLSVVVAGWVLPAMWMVLAPIGDPLTVRACRTSRATRARPGNRVVTNSVNTAEDRLQPGIDTPGGASRQVRPVVAVALLLIGLAAMAMTFVRLPYFIFRPGTVNALSHRIVVFKGEAFPAAGEVYFTTVRQDSTVNGWEYLWAFVDDADLLVDQESVLGDRSRDENRQFNIELMRVSKSTAEAVASPVQVVCIIVPHVVYRVLLVWRQAADTLHVSSDYLFCDGRLVLCCGSGHKVVLPAMPGLA